MKTDELDYMLPPERVAQTPVEPRDAARLLVCNRSTHTLEHCVFHDLPDLLRPGDLLVANDTRVLQARLKGRKPTGGQVELLLLRKLDDRRWEALVGGRNVREVRFPDGLRAYVVPSTEGPLHHVEFEEAIESHLDSLGETPLPPYIHKRLDDPQRYQTVYARAAGSAAAPTAGLHFTPRLFDALRERGVGTAFVTLHVGLDTFKPIVEDDVESHAIHSEWCHLPQTTADAIHTARERGGRIIAVGTTSARVLESARLFVPSHEPLREYSGFTRLFITPGFDFRLVDHLITNFHLPRSTLLSLVGALMGMDFMRHAYADAIAHEYRFYSFGDAMLIR
ncbi:MAG: tRNA preQ1(34) S-adenosylmethionine ribosyltransferase-isomerase QueA [Chloroflexi bacterium]|nr:tRNA preQ1(34) S-adenosylmethionine ribosyltransferase-isomerase QueA [Chloroflexota bacterium]